MSGGRRDIVSRAPQKISTKNMACIRARYNGAMSDESVTYKCSGFGCNVRAFQYGPAIEGLLEGQGWQLEDPILCPFCNAQSKKEAELGQLPNTGHKK